MQQLKQTGPMCGSAGEATANLNSTSIAAPAMAARQTSGPVLRLDQLVVRYPAAARAHPVAARAR